MNSLASVVCAVGGLMGFCCSPPDRESIVLSFGFCGGCPIVSVVEAAAEMEEGSVDETRTRDVGL